MRSPRPWLLATPEDQNLPEVRSILILLAQIQRGEAHLVIARYLIHTALSSIGGMSPIEYTETGGVATDICVLVGQRIRKLRLDKGWTQIYLSVHAGVGRNYISDVELGKKEIGLRNLQLLAQSLGVKLEVLLRGL